MQEEHNEQKRKAYVKLQFEEDNRLKQEKKNYAIANRREIGLSTEQKSQRFTNEELHQEI